MAGAEFQSPADRVSDLYVKMSDPGVRAIAIAAFPEYAGNTVRVGVLVSATIDDAGWQEGSCEYHVMVRLDNHISRPVAKVSRPITHEDLPKNVVLVRHSICCGKDMGLTILCRPDNVTPLLPSFVKLTDDEVKLLRLHSAYNSAYRREVLEKIGLNGERLEAAYQSLLDKGLLTKVRAINGAGRNALSREPYERPPA